MTEENIDRFDFGGAFEGRFSKCTKCDNMVSGKPSLCPECRDLAAGADVALCATERAVLETVPLAHRWADPRAKLWERGGGPRRVFSEAQVEELSRTPRILFWGPTRAGKTTLAVACLRRWARRGRPGLFLSAAELGLARRQHPLGKGEAPAVLAAKRAPLLLIDDLGLDVDDPLSAVGEVIHYRQSNRRPTWVTTGLAMSDLILKYGAHIEGRLLDARVVKLRVEKREGGKE